MNVALYIPWSFVPRLQNLACISVWLVTFGELKSQAPEARGYCLQ